MSEWVSECTSAISIYISLLNHFKSQVQVWQPITCTDTTPLTEADLIHIDKYPELKL